MRWLLIVIDYLDGNTLNKLRCLYALLFLQLDNTLLVRMLCCFYFCCVRNLINKSFKNFDRSFASVLISTLLLDFHSCFREMLF